MPNTIRDVAKLAGCSIKTVSRVLNNEPYVTEETRARVQDAIRALNFSPNISARRLVRQRSNVICILLHSAGYAQTELLSSIMGTGYEYHYDFLVQTYFPASSLSKEKMAGLVRERRIDGLVTTPPCDMDDYIAELVWGSGISLVRINPFDRLIDLPFVAADDFLGARSLMDHLIGLGHQRIAFFKGPHAHRMSADRYQGYRSALEEHGLPFCPELVKSSEFNFDGGYTATKLLLQEQAQPTAIFAGSDEAAVGALYALQQAGKRVPEDISVAGFDDLRHAKEIWPGLTTIKTPYQDLVEQATIMLIAMLNGQHLETSQVILPTSLVVRGSTAGASVSR